LSKEVLDKTILKKGTTAMGKYTTGYSPNASLAIIAEWTKTKGIWEKLATGVEIGSV